MPVFPTIFEHVILINVILISCWIGQQHICSNIAGNIARYGCPLVCTLITEAGTLVKKILCELIITVIVYYIRSPEKSKSFEFSLNRAYQQLPIHCHGGHFKCYINQLVSDWLEIHLI